MWFFYFLLIEYIFFISMYGMFFGRDYMLGYKICIGKFKIDLCWDLFLIILVWKYKLIVRVVLYRNLICKI